MTTLAWEAYAMRYATVQRKRNENFIAYDPHDEATNMDYFVWFLKSDSETILVDTGFNAKAAKDRGRTFLRCPIESLKTAGIALSDVKDTVITHAHYDHAGNTELLPTTRFHLQEREMSYATGKHMRHDFCNHAYDPIDICHLIHANFEKRVQFEDGDYELRSGITVHWVGGHTMGLQIVRVHTKRGWIVLTSDASHYLENFKKRSPFPIVVNTINMLEGYELIEKLADSERHVIAGHDPLMRELYKPVDSKNLEIYSLIDPL